ncbi:MAG TPA: endonuclease/exonuclease/phosphatase family protein [Tepidisphaeraceae bacterium]|jgi:endonuclease/exonuclease/phosphatase family metal-dependent hydrolase
MKCWNLIALGPLFMVVVHGGAAMAQEIRVMTFNIRYANARDGSNSWPNRKELLFKTIEAFDPDLLGLQEVLPVQRDQVRERFAKAYEYLGVGRDDGKEKGEAASVVFRRERFEKGNDGHFWLSPTPEVAGSKGWDADLPRIVTWVELKDRKAEGKRLFFFNTHFDHKGAGARLESATLVRKKINEIANNAPVIMTGDFNAPDGSPPYMRMMGWDWFDRFEYRLTDAFRVIHPTPTPEDFTPHPFTGKNDKPIRIDWILHTDPFRTVEAEIDRMHENGRYPSDHFPVKAVVEWVKPEAAAASSRP